jgi:hypothetical protein
MGKRSSFERREADFYPTPRVAVVPLIPHLRCIKTFAEPCAGDGALVRHLESPSACAASIGATSATARMRSRLTILPRPTRTLRTHPIGAT